MIEKDLYPNISIWLEQYLNDNYKGYDIIVTDECHKQALDVVLRKYGIDCPMAKGLGIEIDIVGILKRKESYKLVFVEVKNVPLTLTHLGQLWGYCQLLDPEEAFLMSPKGLGTLGKIINDLKRVDILKYGDTKKYKSMRITRWNILRNNIDYDTLVE